MQLFVYDINDLTEYAEFRTAQIHKCFDNSKVNWLNIHGLNDIEIIKSLLTSNPNAEISLRGYEV